MPNLSHLLADSSIDIWGLLDKGGTLGAVVLALVTGSRGVWVWGRHYNELRVDRDEWKAHAMRGTAIAEKAASTAEATLEQRTEALVELLEQAQLRQRRTDK